MNRPDGGASAAASNALPGAAIASGRAPHLSPLAVRALTRMPPVLRDGMRWRDDSISSTPVLPRQHLDLTIDPRHHLEIALIGAPFITRYGTIVALGQHEAGKHAGRFLDNVAARGDH
jgi:hypothetical protein